MPLDHLFWFFIFPSYKKGAIVMSNRFNTSSPILDIHLVPNQVHYPILTQEMFFLQSLAKEKDFLHLHQWIRFRFGSRQAMEEVVSVLHLLFFIEKKSFCWFSFTFFVEWNLSSMIFCCSSGCFRFVFSSKRWTLWK